jgi:hypothetical protein
VLLFCSAVTVKLKGVSATAVAGADTASCSLLCALRAFTVKAQVAVILAVPAAIPVTSPLELTVATEGALEAQATAWLVAVAGCTVAVSWSVAPAVMVSLVLFRVTRR